MAIYWTPDDGEPETPTSDSDVSRYRAAVDDGDQASRPWLGPFPATQDIPSVFRAQIDELGQRFRRAARSRLIPGPQESKQSVTARRVDCSR